MIVAYVLTVRFKDKRYVLTESSKEIDGYTLVDETSGDFYPKIFKDKNEVLGFYNENVAMILSKCPKTDYIIISREPLGIINTKSFTNDMLDMFQYEED